jgi:chromosome partitioning protein
MRIISILNFKGGVGKTTLAINLSEALSRMGKRVLLIDCDRQRNATTILPDYQQDGNNARTLREVLLGSCPLRDAIYEARENFFVVPAHSDLEEAGTHITVNGIRTLKHLRNAVQSLQDFEYIFFDNSPSYSKIADAILLASEEMLIPVELEPFSFSGLLDMIDKIGKVLGELEHEVSISGIVPNNLDYTKSMTKVYLKDLEVGFPGRVTNPIRTDAKISKSQEKHKAVYEYDPNSKGANDFDELARFLLCQETGGVQK